MTHKPPIYLIASLIVGGGLNLLTQSLGSALPNEAKLITNIVGVVVAISGFIVSYYQAVSAPATKVVADAQVVSPGTSNPTGATVVSTSSALLPANQPEKGP